MVFPDAWTISCQSRHVWGDLKVTRLPAPFGAFLPEARPCDVSGVGPGGAETPPSKMEVVEAVEAWTWRWFLLRMLPWNWGPPNQDADWLVTIRMICHIFRFGNPKLSLSLVTGILVAGVDLNASCRIVGSSCSCCSWLLLLVVVGVVMIVVHRQRNRFFLVSACFLLFLHVSNEKKPGCLGCNYRGLYYPIIWGFWWANIRIPINQPV